MQGKAAYIRPKVVRPFPGPYASGNYVHRATRIQFLLVLDLEICLTVYCCPVHNNVLHLFYMSI
jgi:hypothetical protein